MNPMNPMNPKMGPKSADNLFTGVGATFLSIVCLTMYLSLSWANSRPAIPDVGSISPITEQSVLQVLVR